MSQVLGLPLPGIKAVGDIESGEQPSAESCGGLPWMEDDLCARQLNTRFVLFPKNC